MSADAGGNVFSDYARYYDLFYRDKDYAGEARFVDGLLRGAGVAGGSLLDIGCGTGAHARELAPLGWRVTGVDLSDAMIALARERAPAGASLEFVQGAATEFALGRTFGAVVSLFHVVSYQAAPGEAERMFANVRRHLTKGGVFVFDFWHEGGVRAEPPNARTLERTDGTRRIVRSATPTHLPEEHLILVDYAVTETDTTTQEVQRVEEQHRMRYFSVAELEPMLRRAGFSVLATHAGLSPAALHPTAWHGLIVARAD